MGGICWACLYCGATNREFELISVIESQLQLVPLLPQEMVKWILPHSLIAQRFGPPSQLPSGMHSGHFNDPIRIVSYFPSRNNVLDLNGQCFGWAHFDSTG